jgi:hypothetical protein
MSIIFGGLAGSCFREESGLVRHQKQFCKRLIMKRIKRNISEKQKKYLKICLAIKKKIFFIIQQVIRCFFSYFLEFSHYQVFIGLFLYRISLLSSPEQDTDKPPKRLLIKRTFNEQLLRLQAPLMRLYSGF